MKKKIDQLAMKAAALGLSALMAVSTPLPALAAEGDVTGNTPKEDPSVQNEKATPAEEAKDQAAALAAGEQKNENGTVTQPAGAVKEAENKENAAVGTAKEAAAETENTNIANAGAALKQAVTDENGNNKATQDILDTENALADAVEADPEPQLADAQKAADEAESAVTDANEQLAQSDKAAADADAKIDEIQNAQDLGTAQKAAAEATEGLTQAKGDAEQNLADIQAKLEDAKAKYEAAKQQVDTYNQAIQNASAEAGAAANDLIQAKNQALALQAVAEQEIQALGQQEKAAMDIVQRQDSQENADKFNWYQGDRQFMDIMNNYYIPNVLQKDAADGSTYELDTDFERTKNSAYADENYIKLFKKDKDGNVVDTLYYNYHLDKDNKGKIVIFEKTPGKRDKEVVVNRTNDNYEKYLEDQQNNSTANENLYFCQASNQKFEEFLNRPENAQLRADVVEARKHVAPGLWKADNHLFDLVMKNYYVPEVLGWKNANVSSVYQYNDKHLKTPGYEGTNSYDGNAAVIEKTDRNGKVIDRKFFNYTYGSELVIYEKTSQTAVKEMDVLLNDNYNNYKNGDSSGILFFESTNQEFNDYIKPAASCNNYNKVKQAAKQAATAAETAENQVNSLKSQIDTLKLSTVLPDAALKALEDQLKAAQDNFARAKDKVAVLNNKLQQTEDALKKAEKKAADEAAKKAADEAARKSAGNDTSAPATPAAAAVPAVFAAPAAAAAPLPAAAAAVDEEEDLVAIDDPQVPLANIADPEESDGEKTLTAIQENQVPLANNELKDEMSWWWLLVVAVLGTAGYTLYRKNKAKKAAEMNR